MIKHDLVADTWRISVFAETVSQRKAYGMMRLRTAFVGGQRRQAMRRIAFAVVSFLVASALFVSLASAGDAEVKAGQAVIDGQLKALIANDGAKAYSFAAPNVKQIFPPVDPFMNMVPNGSPPVRKPQTYSFGKVEQTSPGSIVQQVLIVGPDGKDY